MKLNTYALALSAAAGAMTLPVPAQAGEARYLGQILITTYNYCPPGTTAASGQLLPVSSFPDLHGLLNTTYGGNGTETFGLPNLNGRAPMGRGGGGPGFPRFFLQGDTIGTTEIVLTTDNLPAHTHVGVLRAQSAQGNTDQPVRNSLATARAGQNIYTTAPPANNMNLGDVNVVPTGQGLPIPSLSPGLVMRYCIAIKGAIPQRP